MQFIDTPRKNFSKFCTFITSNYRQIWRPNWSMSLIVSSILGGVNEQISIVLKCLCSDWTAEMVFLIRNSLFNHRLNKQSMHLSKKIILHNNILCQGITFDTLSLAKSNAKCHGHLINIHVPLI